MTRALRRLHLVAVAALVGLLLVAATGCGDDKPDYCSDVSSFESAVSDLKEVSPADDGVDAVKSSGQKVEDTGKAVVSSAKTDFPDETQALNQSLQSLAGTLKELDDPSTAKQALTQVPAQVTAVGSAADTFKKATDSKCS